MTEQTTDAAQRLTPEEIAELIGRLQFVAPRSGNIHGVAMLEDALFVKFQGGKVYRYTASHLDLHGHYTNMLHAESAGSYFAVNVKNNKAIACQLIGTHAEAVLAERHDDDESREYLRQVSETGAAVARHAEARIVAMAKAEAKLGLKRRSGERVEINTERHENGDGV